MQPAQKEKLKMPWQVRTFAAVLLTAGMLTQFNNCGNYADPKKADLSFSSVVCDTPSCITAKSANLNITPHVGAAGEYGVPPALSEFNIGGDCNEGGYPVNTVRWELWLNGAIVRDSGMPVAGTANGNSRCINGRFLVYVNLAPLTSGDTTNRTGLANGQGGRSAYDLWIEIYGQTSVGSALDPSLRYKARVPLSAL